MKVSIITVCLNSEKSIEKTIKSVIEQTYPNIEYIIIDGGSTDGTLKIIEKYKGKISKCISEPDRGLYDAMNKGIDQASGDFIGILNSDDWYELSAVENVVSCFKDESVDIVHGNRKEHFPEYQSSFIRKPNLKADMYCQWSILHPTLFVKKSIYLKYGKFDANYEIAADIEFMLRVYDRGAKYFYLDEVITNFRIGGISCKRAWKGMRELRSIYLKMACSSPNIDRENYIKKFNNVFNSGRLSVIYRYIDKRISRTGYFPISLKNFFDYKMDCIIYGAGDFGSYFYFWCLRRNVKVSSFVDKDPNKQKQKIGDIQINDSQSLLSKKSNQIIVIAVLEAKYEVEKKLIEMGFVHEVDYFFCEDIIKASREGYMKKFFHFLASYPKHIYNLQG